MLRKTWKITKILINYTPMICTSLSTCLLFQGTSNLVAWAAAAYWQNRNLRKEMSKKIIINHFNFTFVSVLPKILHSQNIVFPDLIFSGFKLTNNFLDSKEK